MGGVNDESREANLRASLFTVVKKKKKLLFFGLGMEAERYQT